MTKSLERLKGFKDLLDLLMSTAQNCCSGAFHSTKNSEISVPKLNGTVRIPGKVFENLGIRFEYNLFDGIEYNLFDGISGIIENFHSQEISGLGYGLRLQDAVSNRNGFKDLLDLLMSTAQNCCSGAFHSTKNSEISGPKLNGTVRIPGKVFENLGMRFEYNLFDGISGIIKKFPFSRDIGLGYALRLQDAVSNRNGFKFSRTCLTCLCQLRKTAAVALSIPTKILKFPVRN